MLSYDSLYNAPVDKLQANVDEWTDMIAKVGPLGEELRDTVAGPLKSWSGTDATAATAFIAETGKEFGDAVKEATGIRDILREAHGRFVTQRDELRRIAGQDAPALGLTVDAKGEVSGPLPVENDMNTWRGKQSWDEACRDYRARIQEIQKRIERARANATEADDTAAWALHVNLGGQKHNFTAPAHTTLAGAWEAGSAGNFTGAQGYIFDEMMRNSDSATVARIRELMDSKNPLDRAKGLAMWAAMVAPNRPWDHKPLLADRYGLETLNETYLKDPNGKRAVSYDIWSNIHYGYVGRAAGISRWELENGAQVPVLAGNTDEGDKITVKVGMDIYEKYGPNLTPAQFQQEVTKAINELEGAGAPQVRKWG
ncbi:hypothetical protein BLA60_37335 [Actinophytocola xinjiangensis]|uniref:Bacterial toxin 44 domain-containing protein n=1 Tax=Actinophytocola xinjiangensis TaxID=485602 RepID=A0A7Z0WEP7_9PSEU|nr:polymorphic toxin type 44 domain-containing protein [Actinophytocola xinjiangensis]OLF05183.1 hypothetical protein BLA60_37335 [Actinophytocola xinjiangensis]